MIFENIILCSVTQCLSFLHIIRGIRSFLQKLHTTVIPLRGSYNILHV